MKKTISFEAELTRRVRAKLNPPKMLGPVGATPSGIASYMLDANDYVACSGCGYLNCVGYKCEARKPLEVGVSKKQNTAFALEAALDKPELTQCIEHFSDDERVRFFVEPHQTKIEVCGLHATTWGSTGFRHDVAELIDIIDWWLLRHRIEARYGGDSDVEARMRAVIRDDKYDRSVEVFVGGKLTATFSSQNDELCLCACFNIVDAALRNL